MIGAVVLGVAAGGYAAHGAFHRNSWLFGPTIARIPGASRAVSLTFDDGPNPVATPPILDALAERSVHATFFILGRHADRWPAIVRRIREEGHQLGNHGYHHRKLHFKSPAYVRRDLEMGAAAIEQAAGARPKLFRAPHGFRSPWTTAIASRLGERTVGWTLGVWDTDRPGAAEIARRTIEGATDGSILLLHDGDGYDPAGDRTQTAEAVPMVIDGLRKRGFSFATIPEA